MKVTIVKANDKKETLTNVRKIDFDGNWDFMFHMENGEVITKDRCVIENLMIEEE